MTDIKNNSLLVGRRISGEKLFRDSDFVLKGIRPAYKYVDGTKTEEVVGYTYEIVETGNYDKFRVKVEGTEPLLSQDELAQENMAGHAVMVEFDNLSIMPYINRERGAIYDSIRADAVRIVGK